MIDTVVLSHVHTSECWQETRLPACYEFRIAQLEEKLCSIQDGLRQIGGIADKIESGIKRTLLEGQNVVK